jgi:hypothetical protein
MSLRAITPILRGRRERRSGKHRFIVSSDGHAATRAIFYFKTVHYLICFLLFKNWMNKIAK